MKKYIACLLILVLTIASCKNEAIPKPDDLLSKETMAAILYDITLVNSIKGVNKSKLDDGFMHLDMYLYEKHKTDSLQFKSSNNYYAANPEIYSEIYGIVQARLTKERKEVGEQLEIEQKRRDSISEAKKQARMKKIDTTLSNKGKPQKKKPQNVQKENSDG
ncbi:hypothetical protein KORDIASMS9_00625 [Kordia sp. SMS9]|uniref:DUF4296 domain-containing protein n=1 Tax=Kordia sp. SMS9 TaxID=2282170 RepID=UPI000E0DE7FE|nr:DUF4296 domain-containing protein [Kordia sp. SMS9]AXG68410.1 hypothetical protein KORDIASMS9_00625 [Kordia sp. SMS9]